MTNSHALAAAMAIMRIIRPCLMSFWVIDNVRPSYR
jgi:hypothetical protein